jgi:hypothetical protein
VKGETSGAMRRRETKEKDAEMRLYGREGEMVDGRRLDESWSWFLIFGGLSRCR